MTGRGPWIPPRLSAELEHQTGAFSSPRSEFSRGLRKIPRLGLPPQPSLNGDRTPGRERGRRHDGARILHSPSYRTLVGHGPLQLHRGTAFRPAPQAPPRPAGPAQARCTLGLAVPPPGTPCRHSAPSGREERAARWSHVRSRGQRGPDGFSHSLRGSKGGRLGRIERELERDRD